MRSAAQSPEAAAGGTRIIRFLLGATMTDRLETRADFEKFQQATRQRWDELWQGDKLIVSVSGDSSSEPKGASRVLAACREQLRGTNAVVREVSGNGAMWMEPTVEIKQPGEPPVVYGWIPP